LRQFLTLFPSIMLPMFLALVDQTIVAAALPAIAAELGDVERISLIVVAYLVAGTVSAPIYGRLGDHLGRRRMLIVALAIFIVASLACASASSVLMLAAARVLQGFGGGGLMTLSHALIGETVPPRQRGRYQGFLATIAVSSTVFGPVAGGFLTQHFGWRTIFLINLPIGLLAAVLALRLPVRRAVPQSFRLDIGGVALFAAFIVSALWALQRVQDPRSLDGQGGPILALLAVVALGALLVLVRHERRTSHPVLPVTLLRHPAIWRADALAACHGGVLLSMTTFVPIFLRVVHGASSAEIGFLLLPMTAGVGIGSLTTGQLVSRTGRTAIFPTVGMCAVTVLLVANAFLAPHLTMQQLSWLLGLTAVFMGSVMAVVQITVQAAAGPAMLGAAAASVQISRSLGAAFSTALVGTVLFATLALTDPGLVSQFAGMLEGGAGAAFAAAERAEIAGAFRTAFLVDACLAAAGLILAWSLPLRRI
jgi:MFS family permease